MICPVCSNKLTQMTVADVTVDICKDGCGGIWFDNFELKKFDEPHESAGEALLDIPKNPGLQIDHNKRLKCPKCDDIVMMRHFFSVKHKVIIDECPGCGGIWLDAGELGQIRKLFKSEEERQKATDEYFDALFGDELKAMKDTQEAKLARTGAFANMFKWLCPSAHLPGKQSWGAF